mmetsp:Transcript_5857/g.22197  ORF Transcript_5857/g.22197 Transcript_5857/m.22197 type:complete len:245 (+) Transcript_5857:6728-7462(+)
MEDMQLRWWPLRLGYRFHLDNCMVSLRQVDNTFLVGMAVPRWKLPYNSIPLDMDHKLSHFVHQQKFQQFPLGTEQDPRHLPDSSNQLDTIHQLILVQEISVLQSKKTGGTQILHDTAHAQHHWYRIYPLGTRDTEIVKTEIRSRSMFHLHKRLRIRDLRDNSFPQGKAVDPSRLMCKIYLEDMEHKMIDQVHLGKCRPHKSEGMRLHLDRNDHEDKSKLGAQKASHFHHSRNHQYTAPAAETCH